VALAVRNALLAHELASILRACEARGMAHAPLRGLALAERLYGDITARPMGDIDLLVRKADLPEVAEALKGLGFKEMDRRPGFARTFSYTLEFFKDRHGWVIVEPHWSIAYPPFVDRVDMEAVWNRCVRGQVVGADAWLLSPEDLFVHLCFHLIHRGDDAPLLWFYELDRLLRHKETALDWQQVVLIARQAGLGLFVAEVLGKVKDLFDSPVPDLVLSELRAQVVPHAAPAVGRSVESRLVRLLAGGFHVDGVESFALFFTIRGLRAKARYTLALLFPSPQFMLLQYGLSRRWQLPLCYLARVVHLCWEALKGISGLLHSSRVLPVVAAAKQKLRHK
ncbi:MAG: nucleotidyltransferase family protein, partial [candidate division NC10 bacterium]|nr:nucleotidyltransferase family protein [candidate division NC10 bacterium]